MPLARAGDDRVKHKLHAVLQQQVGNAEVLGEGIERLRVVCAVEHAFSQSRGRLRLSRNIEFKVGNN